MKKLILSITCFIITILSTSLIFYANDNENSILIKTSDCSKAIDALKERLPDMADSLKRFGFKNTSKIGTPFAKEYYPFSDDESNITYRFPVIDNGKIIFYIEISISENIYGKSTHFAVGDLEESIDMLNDGNAYVIIRDYSNFTRDLAVSDEKIIDLYTQTEINKNEAPILAPLERKIVDITKPIDIDTSIIIPQTEEERIIFENAEKNGKIVIQKNVDSLGAINKNNRILVPLRDIAELIGCTVDWDNNTRAAYAKKNDNIVKFVIGRTEYSVNDKTRLFHKFFKIHQITK